MTGSGQENPGWKTIQAICKETGMSVKSFRKLQQRFADLLPMEERNGKKGLGPESYAKLQLILHSQQQGMNDEAIRQQFHRPPEDPVVSQEHALLQKLEAMNELLERQEKRQTEERDRLMMVLMRTQQEIQHLRYEVAAAKSRRDRKKPWWNLFSRG